MANNNYIGKTVGNYRILAELGSGSFGVVYRCEHVFLQNRIGAIKLMHASHLDSQEERDNFIREARLLEMLRHPHILPILDVGVHDGFPYLVTEYAPLGSLRDRQQRIDPRLLPMEESLKILSQVGMALDHAHAQNIIHRDLKPANILFNARGDALLADFGIATTLATASIKFVEASGSPPYMAPEQFQGTISKESDQYALACIAYELLTGNRPFSAPDPFTLGYKHLMETPVPPTQYNAAIPASIEQAILKAMAKERMERFPNVAAFIAALRPLPSYQGQPSGESLPITGGPTLPASQFPPLVPGGNAPTWVRGGTPASGTGYPAAGTPAPLPASPYPPQMSGPIARGEEAMWMQAGSPAQPAGPSRPIYAPTQRNMPTLPAQQNPYANSLAPYPMAAPPTPPPMTQLAYGQTPTPSPATQRTYGQPPAPPPPFLPPANAGQMLSANAGLSQITTQNKAPKRRRWPMVLAAILVLLLILIPGGVAAYYTFAYPATATVTLTPLNKDLKNTFTITQVTKNPNTALNQVAGARLISATKFQAASASATGSQTISASGSYGSLTVSNGSSNGYGIFAHGSITSKSGITIVTDNSYEIYVAPGSTVSVPSHSATTGSRTNIPAYDVNDSSGGVTVYNPAAFSGGRDAGTYNVVQQHDIDVAANPLKVPVQNSALGKLQGSVQVGEKFVSTPTCSTKVTSDHNVGDPATTFNVTVTSTCAGEVYNPQDAQSLAEQELRNQASTSLDPSYVLAGSILTTVMNVSITNAKTGALSLVIAAEGIWNFNFNTAQKLTLAKLIAGKSAQDAQAVLAEQNGVKSAQVNVADTFLFWNSVPTNTDSITVTIHQVSVPMPQVAATPGVGTKSQTPTASATP